MLIETLPPPRLHVAPMQCYTNSHCRVLLRYLSSDAILWTEMEKAADVLAHPERLKHESVEHPLVLQLGGDDLSQLSAASAAARAHGGFCELNLNAGCPSITTGGADFGASLMTKASHTRRLLEEMAAASDLPVSVKCRIGVHERLLPDGTVPEDQYEQLYNFIDEVSGGGATSHVIVHARAAILGGLSPSKNRCIPPLRHDYVRRLADDFPHLVVTINGGLALDGAWRDEEYAWLGSDRDGVRRIDGVMFGRDVLRRPLHLWCQPHGFDHSTAARQQQQSPLPPQGVRPARSVNGRSSSRSDAIERYTRYACLQVARQQASARDVLQPLTLIAQQLHEEEDDDARAGGSGGGEEKLEDEAEIFGAVWDGVAAVMDERGGGRGDKSAPAAAELLRDYSREESSLPTKQLLKLVSRALGKKEANKIARNRAESVLT